MPHCPECNKPLRRLGEYLFCPLHGQLTAPYQLDQIYPLRRAENNILQVLLGAFSLERVDECATLELRFNENTPAIRRREAKAFVERSITQFDAKAIDIQKQLDAILVDGTGEEYDHSDEDFVFRYSNGGTLPIVRREGKDYYCLFYRDVKPVGWNIANGASDTIEELLDPAITIERELCEELVVIDRDNKINYVFSWGSGETIDRPEFEAARKLWGPFLANKSILDFDRQMLPVKWQLGPDSMRIRFGHEAPQVWSGGYLNINALDFGIEVDRIAYFNLPKEAVLLDGEINDNRLINRPIGLFEVNRLKDSYINDNNCFTPDLLFFSGTRHKPEKLERLIRDEFQPWLLQKGIRGEDYLPTYEETEIKFDLCPVTRRIILRHQPDRTPDSIVFTSYSHEDTGNARRLVTDLRQRNVKVWRDADDLPLGVPWDDEVQATLNKCSHVLVISTPRSVKSTNVRDELNFAVERKKIVIPLIFESCELPLRIHRLNWVDFQDDYQSGLDFLMERLLPQG